MLEAKAHEDTCFITLTYADEFIPRTDKGLETLSIRDHQLFLKSLRRRLPPSSLRYYLIGEYGETTFRPHYHAALFGIGPDSQEIVQESWGKGHIHVGNLEKESAQYIVGYVTKKMTSKYDPRLDGRQPEYARMSNRGGGMGISAIKDIANHLAKLWGEFGLPEDVPRDIGIGPLDRYARTKIRLHSGFSEDGKTPQAVLSKMRQKEMEESQKENYYEENRQKLRNTEYKLNLFNRRKHQL